MGRPYCGSVTDRLLFYGFGSLLVTTPRPVGGLEGYRSPTGPEMGLGIYHIEEGPTEEEGNEGGSKEDSRGKDI